MTTTTARIHVTTHHIARGERDSAFGDPIALAIYDAIGFTGMVGSEVISFEGDADPCDLIHTPMPKQVREFIRQFDATGTGKPFTFDLTVPAWPLASVACAA